MTETTAVTSIAHSIQMAVAPVFLLAGIAGFLNLLAGRLARVVDRARVLEATFTETTDPAHGQQVRELRLLDRRIHLVSHAILLCTASAVAICLVVAGLFIAALAHLNFGRAMAIAFILAMTLLIAGLSAFLVEVRLALRTVRIPDALLERERKGGRR